MEITFHFEDADKMKFIFSIHKRIPSPVTVAVIREEIAEIGYNDRCTISTPSQNNNNSKNIYADKPSLL